MSTTTKKQQNFEAKFEKLDKDYRLLLARRDMLDQLIREKETEIQTLLDKAAGLG